MVNNQDSHQVTCLSIEPLNPSHALALPQELCQGGDVDWVAKWCEIIMVPKGYTLEEVSAKLRSLCGVSQKQASASPGKAPPSSGDARSAFEAGLRDSRFSLNEHRIHYVFTSSLPSY